jgi:alkanesulfonate monooxygenase SsuD/methylene tetrahydromethanopterin reductase-like flavin-dependent oxidoreductase (luciferase family)
MLDREGADGPGGIAIVGDRSALAEQLDRLRALGTTDFLAVPFPVGNDPQESLECTREFLIEQLPADAVPA